MGSMVEGATPNTVPVAYRRSPSPAPRRRGGTLTADSAAAELERDAKPRRGL
jgi:hypothetical protein